MAGEQDLILAELKKQTKILQSIESRLEDRNKVRISNDGGSSISATKANGSHTNQLLPYKQIIERKTASFTLD